MTLQEELERINQQEEAEIARLQEILDAEEAIRKQIEAKREELRALQGSLSERDVTKWDMQQQVRKVSRKKQDIINQIEVEREQQRLLDEAAAEYKTFEEMSQDAPWRIGNKDGNKAYKHQIDGAYLLASAKRAILADSMGTGKTCTSIATLDLVGAKRVLIISPGEVLTGFEQEIRDWSPNRPPIIIGKKPKAYVRSILKMIREANAPEYVFLINYESWARDKALLIELQSMLFDTVILDEAHTVKETDTSAYKGVEQIILGKNSCSLCHKFICHHGQEFRESSVKNVYPMTGTPILNRPQEIYPLLHLINPRLFYAKSAFLNQYCEMDRNTGHWRFRMGGMQSLASKLSGMYLRRTLESAGVVLPNQKTVIHELEMDDVKYKYQAELLEKLEKDAAIQISEGKAVTLMSILALITRQRQAATWPGGIILREDVYDEYGMQVFDDEGQPVKNVFRIQDEYKESIKIDRAMELLDEWVQDGRRIVVFSQFKEVLYELKRRCDATAQESLENPDVQEIRAVEFHGDTPQNIRDEVKTNFNRATIEASGEKPKWDVVLAHFKTGGVGLNLTAATVTLVMDEEWNPGKNEQAYGRTKRIGQTEETSVHILRLADSIDDWMAGLNDEKAQTIEGFNNASSQVDALKNMLTSKLKGKVSQ